jgi:hypothetical protein
MRWALVAAAATLLLAAPGAATGHRRIERRVRVHVARTVAHRQGSPRHILITTDVNAAPIPLPPSFLGLSTEYWGLPRYERRASVFERVLALVHASGDGPLVVRIGGDSADHSYWSTSRERMPPRAFRLTSAWVSVVRAFVRRTGAQLLIDLNLAANSPLMAARWARTVMRGLPRASVIGFEVGNEPDLYERGLWYPLVRIAGTRLRDSVLAGEFGSGSYVRDFNSYARALASVAPQLPLVGPAVANPELNGSWVVRLIAGARRGLGIVSAHRYPLSACKAPGSPGYPTIARLLGEGASAGMARSVGSAARLAHDAGLPFRLTELNSVTCGGLRGVSDTFATALWAPDALFELMRAGIDGVNVHIRADAINAPFTLSRRGVTAHPFLYGLILFARTLGPAAQLIPVRERAPVKAWLVRVDEGEVHLLVINKGSRAAVIRVRLPGTSAIVERLLAPSPRASSGVTLAGQWLGPGGTWRGRRKTESITGRELRVPAFSAALVIARPTPGGLSGTL